MLKPMPTDPLRAELGEINAQLRAIVATQKTLSEALTSLTEVTLAFKASVFRGGISGRPRAAKAFKVVKTNKLTKQRTEEVVTDFDDLAFSLGYKSGSLAVKLSRGAGRCVVERDSLYRVEISRFKGD